MLRSRYPYADEVERKASPRKRRRNSSTSKEEATPPITPPPAAAVTMGNIGSSLDSLVEAAKLITTNQEASENCAVKPPPTLDIVISTPSPSTITGLSHIDSTTNMAATAMLELLGSNATILPPAQAVDPLLHQDFNRGTNDTVKPSFVEFVDNSIPKTDVPAEQLSANIINSKPEENTNQHPQLIIPPPFASLTISHTGTEDIHPRFEEVESEKKAVVDHQVLTTNEVVNDYTDTLVTNTNNKIEDCENKIPVSSNSDIQQQINDETLQSKEDVVIQHQQINEEASLQNKEEVAIPSAASISSSTMTSEE